ncbi:MAG TPA: flagellar basal body P-ring protein FlgI [Candidatus Hydrogenedentes bacterium]|nr:flagellar basal body P-ring protein FlgI [Candidatus Hydrogenedentota bacterium]HPG66640.1 flagellar basal body P-ring protein FlgI [Candidatus Hydrogenedentota bacterium]
MSIQRHRLRWIAGLIVLALLFMSFCSAVSAARIRDLCEIQGARGNKLIGTGIVVGLAGTGDKANAAVIAQQRMLERLDIKVDTLKELNADNCAIVMVTAELPAFAKEGTQIDVNVDSLYDCESLEGGTLLETHLRPQGGGETVYAVAQGSVSVGGFNAGGGGGTVTRNHVTGGRIPMGAYVEREAPSTITDGQRLVLVMKRPDFGTAHHVQTAINEAVAEDTALALGAGAVHVTIPSDQRRDLVGFVVRLQEIDVDADMPARVVINERTGTIVVGGDVRIKPCQVAHGSLTIRVQTTPLVSQPAPFGGGETVVAQVAETSVEESEAYLMPVEGASAGDVAAALNKLKVTPRDMISIFQALREAGALDADLEIM